MAAFFLSLREGLEAALIVGILLGALRRFGHRELGRYVWFCVFAALLLSAVIAAGLARLGVEFEGRGEQLFEGVTLILAAGFLTTMIFWMQGQGSQLRKRLEAGVALATGVAPATRGADAAAQAGYGRLSLFSIAFLAVFREGVELALLLAAMALSTSPLTTLLGSLAGIGTAALLGVLIFQGVLRLNVRTFFRVTNVALLVFAAGMLALGVHELIEAGLVPAVMDPVWNINSVLNDETMPGEVLKGLLGYNGNPALTEVVVYVGYIGAVGWALLRGRGARGLKVAG
jgi:high-affinity iron transporter